jgi:hypothetical protein
MHTMRCCIQTCVASGGSRTQGAKRPDGRWLSQLGTPVRVRDPAFPERPFPGTIIGLKGSGMIEVLYHEGQGPAGKKK